MRNQTTADHRSVRGFTLVELLVVIAIISALAGLLVPVVRSAKIKSKKTQAKNTINAMALSLEAYNSDWADYPPTSLSEYDVPVNGMNDGIESVLAHLTSRRKGGPYYEDYKEEQLENYDDDRVVVAEFLEQINWLFGDDQLRELVDPFGNPFVYFHNRDYEISYKVNQEFGEKSTVVQAGQSKKTATYFSPLKYQMWSMGPNGKSDTGPETDSETSDDIGSW